jgi:hypothetical protein
MDITDRAPRTWFIPEAGSGTVLALTRAAVKRGDNVVALVSRADDLTNLTDVHHERLRVIAADIGDQVQLQEAATEAVGLFGCINVVANAAFYDLPAPIEEISDIQAVAVFERTVFGTLNVLRATLPALRAQRSGHVLQVTDVQPEACAGRRNAHRHDLCHGGSDRCARRGTGSLGHTRHPGRDPSTTTQVISGTDLTPADSISDYDAKVPPNRIRAHLDCPAPAGPNTRKGCWRSPRDGLDATTMRVPCPMRRRRTCRTVPARPDQLGCVADTAGCALAEKHRSRTAPVKHHRGSHPTISGTAGGVATAAARTSNLK